jgi:hypothetical protein
LFRACPARIKNEKAPALKAGVFIFSGARFALRALSAAPRRGLPQARQPARLIFVDVMHFTADDDVSLPLALPAPFPQRVYREAGLFSSLALRRVPRKSLPFPCGHVFFASFAKSTEATKYDEGCVVGELKRLHEEARLRASHCQTKKLA